jgi:transposase
MRQMTKMIIAYELLEEGMPKTCIAERLNVSRRTVIRWAQAIEQSGSLETYLEYYQRAKQGLRRKRKCDAILKRRIWALREKYHDCCGQKIQYFLQKEYQIKVSVTTIYKVLAEKYELRSRWRKNHPRGPIPVAQVARQVLQMDSVAFGEVFAFTAIDIYSKESAVLLRPTLEAADGHAFLHICLPGRFDGHVELIQTDGGSEFQGLFSQDVLLYCDHHRVARPYKKNEQAFIESFNRSLRKECLGWAKYKPAQIPQLTLHVEDWLHYYHYERPHISLGMRPPLHSQV